MSTRFNWDVFPSTKLEASHMLTPLGCLFTPAYGLPVQSHSTPIQCDLCISYINQYIRIDRQNKMWWCPFCEKRSFLPDGFPLHEKGSENNDIPLEIRPNVLTIDYVLAKDIAMGSETPFVVVYVIDLYQHTDSIESKEFDLLKEAISESIHKLPKNTLVGIVTYAEDVDVYVSSGAAPISFLPGLLFGDKYDYNKIFTDSNLTSVLFRLLRVGSPPSSRDDSLVNNAFLSPELLLEYIQNLKPVLTDSYKPPRSTGIACYIAALMLSQSFSNLIGKISVFISGPPTLSPGKIVDKGTIRSHHDVANFKAPNFVPALRFYQALSYVAAGYQPADVYNIVYTAGGKLTDYSVSERAPTFSFDIYTGALDQVGVYEMRHLANSGSGSILLSETFASHQFKQTLLANTAAIATEKHNTKLAVATSRGLKVMKSVSHGTELQSSYQSDKLSSMHQEKISDMVTQFDSTLKKRNFTNKWYLGSLDSNDTLAIYFEMETVSSSSLLNAEHGVKEVYIQFQAKWWDIELQLFVLRITTLKKITTLAILAAHQVKMSDGTYRLVNTKSSIVREKMLLDSFDYKAWIVLFTRLLTSKIDTTIGYESFDEVVKDVDIALIRLTKFFGGLQVQTHSSHNPYENLKVIHSISEKFRELPGYSYSLRRNPQLVRIFNSSPDETAYYHHIFIGSNAEESCMMIQPSFYQAQEGLESVLLDVSSLKASESSFYVLDSVFSIIVFHQCVEGEKLKLHNSNNDDLVYGERLGKTEPVLHLVDERIAQRSVIPKIILTQNGHSQARFLMARLNPVQDKPVEKPESKWWNIFTTSASPVLMTDEVSVSTYYDELLDKVKNYDIHDS